VSRAVRAFRAFLDCGSNTHFRMQGPHLDIIANNSFAFLTMPFSQVTFLVRNLKEKNLTDEILKLIAKDEVSDA